MKLLHTGDWHIGKLVHGIHMTEDQRHILKQLIALIEKEKPDVLIIAGDIYDRSVPPIEAVELLDETLTEIIAKQQIQVMAVAGNHDSPDRVGFASRLLKDKGLHISGHLQTTIEPITIEDSDGPVNFYLIPYTEPALVRELYGNPYIKSHDDAMKCITEGILSRMNPDERNVCIAHAFLLGVENLETSDSVRPLSIGGSEYVDAAYFEAFDYTALGHLHRPQRVLKDHIRYAGSLLKYSFSEAKQQKSVAIVELNAGGETDVTLHQLVPLRDMRVIKGQLENLVDQAVYGETNTEDYIMAVLTDQGELIDTIQTLRAVYPNVLRVEKESYDRTAGEESTSAGDDFEQKQPLELFQSFFENISGDAFEREMAEVVAGITEGIEQKGRVS